MTKTYTLTDEWFDLDNEKYWFDANDKDDDYLTDKYSNYIPKDLFEQMLIYDQLIRHFKRSWDRRGIIDERNNIIYLENCKSLAKNIAYNLLNNSSNIVDSRMRVFLLLPYRHTHLLEDAITAKNIVLNWLNNTIDNNEIAVYSRFYKYTIEEMSKYTHVVKVLYDNRSDLDTWHKLDNIKLLITKFKEPLDKTCLDLFIKNKLLNEEDSKNKLLEDQKNKLLEDSKNIIQIINNVVNNLNKFKKQKRRIVISFSGGVDSTVCLYLAKVICNIDVVAVHINYKNRDTADIEENMIAWYCQLLNVPLYVRRIHEITRTRDNLREFYENITKKIRFASYKQVLNAEEFTQTDNTDDIDLDCVILGHNKTDCEENIIHNLRKWQNIDNLFGMEESKQIDGICIVRPMLEISKEEIRSIASYYNLPYFKNSTPDWSERGIARTQILPSIPDDIRQQLCKLTTHITELSSIAKEYIYNISINENAGVYKFVLPDNKKIKIIYELLFKRLNIKISQKCMSYMLNRNLEKRIIGKIRLNKYTFMDVHENGTHKIYISKS